MRPVRSQLDQAWNILSKSFKILNRNTFVPEWTSCLSSSLLVCVPGLVYQTLLRETLSLTTQGGTASPGTAAWCPIVPVSHKEFLMVNGYRDINKTILEGILFNIIQGAINKLLHQNLSELCINDFYLLYCILYWKSWKNMNLPGLTGSITIPFCLMREPRIKF